MPGSKISDPPKMNRFAAVFFMPLRLKKGHKEDWRKQGGNLDFSMVL